MERYWELQQLPYILAFGALGGFKWIAFGVCARVYATVHGHFLVGHLCHHKNAVSSLTYRIAGADVQGYNIGSKVRACAEAIR